MSKFFKKKYKTKIEYDEILIDASNLPAFNRNRMEGRIELPIANRNVFLIGVIFFCFVLIFSWRLYYLQIVRGEDYRQRSESNRIDEGVIIAERGVLYDRNGELLAWNENDYSGEHDFPVRAYTDRVGLGQLIGYVSYPQKDSKGFYYRTDYIGRTGVESAYEDVLHGENGKILIEVDALSNVISASAVQQPRAGQELNLSVDAGLSEAMYTIIATSSAKAGFRSGAAAIMDVTTGEIIAMTSFPSYDPEVMADGDNVELISAYNTDERFPFLNKVVGGAYTPGSIVKPFMAYAALAEGVISAHKTIRSDGELIIPNPYSPSNPSRFGDWRAHGATDMATAIAFSSDVYFYIVGGGLPAIAAPQAGIGVMEGLGITKINTYMRLFGFGRESGINLSSEQAGTVPDPAWKEEVFSDDWRLGDTYLTSIGQFGFQVTPLQMLRAYGALANGGKLFVPHVQKDVEGEYEDLALNPEYLQVVHKGMRMAVNFHGGTARSLERSDVAIAAKSGTAELGANNEHVNSWAAGFFPYDEPRYSFIMLMEWAPRSNTLGATTVMGDVIEWMSEHRPEYLGIEEAEG